jgi:hypothetical protein
MSLTAIITRDLPTAAQLYATFAAFYRPNQLAGAVTACGADGYQLICLEINSHKVFYGTWTQIGREQNDLSPALSLIVTGSA